MRRRENTFRVDYSNVPKKPTSEEVHRFVATMLGLNRDQVQRIQCSRSLGCAFVKVVDLATAQKVVEENGDEHDIVIVDKHYPMKITMEDGAVDVKVTDLSENVTDAAITEFLKQFGEVISIQEQISDEGHFFEGLPTGVRIVRMMVKKNIPSFVVIDTESTAISYFGQRHTCRHCGDFVHNGVSCVINKKLLAQKLAADNNSTYASVAKQPAKSSGSGPSQGAGGAPKKGGAVSKQVGGQPSSSQHHASLQFTSRSDAASKPNTTVQTSTNTTTTTANSNMPAPPVPAVSKKASDDATGNDGNDSDTSSASTESRSRRNRNKKQKTDHEAENSSL